MMKNLSTEPFNEIHISSIKNSKFEMSPMLADKFINQYAIMLNTLFEQGADSFQREYNHTNGEEAALLLALLTQKRRLKTLIELCTLSFFEEDLQTQLKKVIYQAADQMQSSLEDSAKSDRSGRLLHLIKNNAVNRLDDIQKGKNVVSPIKTGRRQILL